MSRRKKKKRTSTYLISALAFLLLSVTLLLLPGKSSYRKAKYSRYPEFGIIIPEDYVIHGIDVSKYQDMIAWEEVKNMKVKNIQLGFAFIKATEGIGNAD